MAELIDGGDFTYMDKIRYVYDFGNSMQCDMVRKYENKVRKYCREHKEHELSAKIRDLIDDIYNEAHKYHSEKYFRNHPEIFDHSI